MRRFVFAGCASCLLAMLAMEPSQAQSVPVYSSMTGPYFTFGYSKGLIGYDDYTMSIAGQVSSTSLYSLAFHGGVATPNTPLTFVFDTSAGITVASFSAVIPTADVTTWTIPAGNLVVPTIGRFFVETTGGANAEWDLTQTPPSVGSNSNAYGTGPDTGNAAYYNVFALNAATAPEPETFYLAVSALVPALIVCGIHRRR